MNERFIERTCTKRNGDFLRYQLWRVSGNGSRELVRDETIPRQYLEQRGDRDHNFPVETGGWMHIDFSGWVIESPPPTEISDRENIYQDIGTIKNCAGCVYYISRPHNACNALHSPPSNIQETFKPRDCADWEARIK